MALKSVYDKLVETPNVVRSVTTYDFGVTKPAIFVSNKPPVDAGTPCICIYQSSTYSNVVKCVKIDTFTIVIDYYAGSTYVGKITENAARRITDVLNDNSTLKSERGEICSARAGQPVFRNDDGMIIYSIKCELRIYL